MKPPTVLYLIGLMLFLCIPTTNTAGQVADTIFQIRDLEKGKPVERAIAATDTHYYRVTLKAGEFLRALVDQRGIDLIIIMYSPDGQKILEVDSPNGIQGPEPIAVEAETSGSFRIEVRSLEKNVPPGRYEARIEEILTAEQYAARGRPGVKPTLANVAYGTHERQVLDFYKAESDKPTPLLFFIHGGGWVNGDKAYVASPDKYLAAGISIVSINYRYSWQAQIAGVKPPVEWPLHDAARALQFVRSKAGEWNIDKQRIGASGSSAGACSSLWLALHNDMADLKSSDPIARESTRLWCAAVLAAQTSLDPLQLKEWTPNSYYGGHAFGFMDPTDLESLNTRFAQFLAAREEVLPWIKEYSPYEHVSADDPPIYLIYPMPPALGQDQRDPTHTANFGVKLQEKLRSVGVECELVYPGAPDVKHEQIYLYLIEKLKGPAVRKN